MICDQLSTLIGFECCPLTAAGDVALIETPFAFADGEGLPVYTEIANGQIRFFDDGGVILHFLSRGLRLENKRQLRFITAATEQHGTALSDAGEIEVWSSVADAPTAFARYLSTLLQISAWEASQQDVNQDTSLLVDEVIMALRSWRPDATLVQDPAPIEGISGQLHKLDALFDGQGVVVTGTHHSSVNSSLRRLVDLHARPANSELSFLVVIDDRIDPDAATREAKILQAVATVLPFTQLERNAGERSRAIH